MIHLDPSGLALLAGASLLAAAINAVAGGGTLVSFPALLLLGYPALVANVTNTLGLVAGYAGGSTAYRRELRGQRSRVIGLGAIAAVGASGGAVLLTHTSPATFAAVVPWLILAGCALLGAQPLLRRVRSTHLDVASRRRHGVLLGAGDAVAGVYGAFFGAGLGIVVLAILGAFVRDDLQRLNALKGVLSLVINIVAALYFALFAPVAWGAAAVMFPCSLAGGFAGVAAARRLSPSVLRALVVAYGVAVALRLLL